MVEGNQESKSRKLYSVQIDSQKEIRIEADTVQIYRNSDSSLTALEFLLDGKRVAYYSKPIGYQILEPRPGQ